MSNSILPAAGNLDIVNAKVRADKFEATTSIAVSNTNPDFDLSVGTRFHVDKDSVDPVSVTGNVVASGIKISNLTISPAFDFASVSNVGNVTANVIQFANATTGFTTTANVEIGGNITLTSNAQVKVGSNVLAEYTGPHPREPKEMPLKKFPEIVFDASKFDKNDTTNTYTQGGYTISANTQYNDGEYAPWDMYVTGPGPLTGTHYWSSDSTQLYNAYWGGTLVGSPSAHYQTVVSSVTYNGVFTTIQLPHKIKLNSIDIQSHKSVYFPHSGIIAGSTDGSTWHLIHSFSDLSTPDTPVIENIITNSAGNTNHYNYLRLIITKGGGNAYIGIRHLRWNGYEEPAPPGDLSLDTTLKSTFNSVRSNNYVMYFDGEGFIPGNNTSNNLVDNKSVIHHNATYDTTEKYWTLDGSTESNVTTGSLGFEGDAPHTVSTWINASNLEANATTQQLFSIGSGYDKAFLKVDDTQIAANTWHNVTYAYQGEGGSKVTYVDGRKVEEAQVEDTLGAYPPFEMAGYKTGGYCVSASSEHDNGVRLSWKAFESGTGNETGLFMFNEVGPKYGPTATTSAALFEGVRGEWIKLELPEKIYIDWLFLRGSQGSTQSPEQIRILGSNDDVNWDVVKATFTVSNPAGDSNDAINSTKAYKYIILQVIKVNGSNAVQIKQILYYGHKEGDLTRFPEPTRVLKYPHVTMTGPAQRGYVASASNETLADGNRVWHVFDENDSTFWKCDERYTSAGVENTSSGLTDTSSTAHGGEYVVLESPNKLNITGFNLTRDGTNSDTIGRSPGSIAFLGKNSAPTVTTGWTLIAQQTTSTYTNNVAPLTISGNSNYFKYHAVVIRSIDGNQLRFHIKNIELLGTQEDTGTPAIVGGPFAGKVANFRVYDQYLGDERIQEIYDAQKDEFGHKKSSMTLYKGRIGVGTTEPEGSLTVLDEPHALAKFPVRAVPANDSYVEGNGHIKLSAADGSGYQAFDGLTSTSWTAKPTRNTRVSEEVDFGAWLKVETPESMSLKKAEIESNPYWNQVGSGIDGTTNGAQFGRAVACNHNGTRIIVGGYGFNSNQGKVIVYDWNGTAWTQVGNVLTGSVTGVKFGHSVAISGDGNIIAVSAIDEDPNSVSDSGTVRVYYLVGSTWTILPDSGSLTSSGLNDVFVGESVDDHLGYGGVKLSYDGKTIVMGEYEDDTGFSNAGRVKVYTYANGAWSQKGSSLTGGATNERFGSRISMSEDGNHLILATDDGGSSGSNPYVKVYEYDGSNWTQKGSTLNYTENDGWQIVDISNDGNVVVIGHKNADAADGALNDGNGVVRVYHYESSAWVLKSTLADDESSDDQFGGAVVISGDGKRIIVSAAQWANGSADYTGRLFTFEYSGGSWERRTPTPVDATTAVGAIGGVGNGSSNNGHLGYGGDDAFGLAMSRDGSTIVGGEIGYTAAAGGNSGRARVFSMPSNIKSIWGSNDDTNWTKIVSGPTREEATSNVAGLAFGYDDRLEFKNLDNPNYYKYHAIVADAFTRLKDVKLYGIRNQGSSTLHDGTLTLTKKVTAPQLESTGTINMKGDYTEILANSNVVTEFSRSKKLIKYPRVALTSAQSAPATENGYTVTVSNETGNKGIGVFDGAKGANSGTLWFSGTLSHYATSDGSAVTSGTNIAPRLDTNTDYGEWISIQLPVAIKLISFHLWQQYNDHNHFPQSATIYGKKETNDQWSEIFRYDNRTRTLEPDRPEIFDGVNSDQFYKYFALVGRRRVQGANDPDGISIGEWELYGVPEYDPEAHGTDVTVKSVANVPNTDWLEVYYDGQDYTQMPTTVTDKSGNNRNGTPTGGVVFDTGYKAFTFDGTNDGISATSTATLSNHTASMWIKFEEFSGWVAVYAIRPASLDRNNTFLYANSDGRFRLEALGGSNSPYKDFTYRFEPGKWVHLTVFFRSSGLIDSKIYIDNVELVPNGTERSLTDDITITGNTTVYIGSEPGYFFNGSVANFRLFNRVLTSDEIYQLYAYQKEYFGHGDLGMTLKNGRLGIGTSEPRAALDVRGDVTVDSIWLRDGAVHSATSEMGVGIGITNPPAKLYVKTTGSAGMGANWGLGDFVVSHGVGYNAPSQSLGVAMGVDGTGDNSAARGYLWCMRPLQTWNTLKIQGNKLELIGLTSVTTNNGVNVSSDDRLKTEEEFIQDALPTIMKLKPQTYRKHPFLPNDPSKEVTENMTEMPSDLSQLETGLIVQDIWYDAPELRHLVKLGDNANPSEVRPVDPDPNDPTQDPDYSSWGTTPTTLGYQGVFVVALKAIQELNTELQAERVKVTTLETQLASVLTRLDALENA